MESIINNYKKNKLLFNSILLLMLIAYLLTFIIKTFSSPEPIKSVEIYSNNLNYQNNEPGSWKITKSAEWTDYGKARITIDLETVLSSQATTYKDIIMVLDISGSMFGEKINKVKNDSIELINSVLSDTNNKIALVTFETNSTLVSTLTNDKNSLIDSITNLNDLGNTNYYDALKNVETILENYTKENNRECIVLFLTDGYPNTNTPNEVGEYNFLKSTYPYVTFNGIQYEMGNAILEPIAKISDKQYIASMDTLNNILFEASLNPIKYDSFVFTDYINTEFFNVASIKDIYSKVGEYSLNNNKVTWHIDNLRSGAKCSLTIEVTLKEEYLNIGGTYPTNSKEEVTSKIENTNENITSNLTPILANNYIVIYDGNLPPDCSINNIPTDKTEKVFTNVKISDTKPICPGYTFAGWRIVNEEVNKINDDYFIMPESNVTIRGMWSKLSINKSMDGTIRERIVGTLMPETLYNEKVFNTNIDRDKVKSITLLNYNNPSANIEYYDISVEQNSSVLLWYNETNDGLYDIYIGADGGIIANENSSYLFGGMGNLVTINNLNLLDTSNVTDMSGMFAFCTNLTNIDLSNFNTSKVTNMYGLFAFCEKITSLNLSGFNTDNVTKMDSMFTSCSSLTTLDLSNFNTNKVTDMNAMFNGCSNLISLNLTSFNTSNVTSMSTMFMGCSKLEELNLSNFNTSNVATMFGMFSGCESLASLNISSFNTSNVTDMSSMFGSCRNLTTINVSSFNTSNVETMVYMFEGCQKMTTLDLSNFNTSNVTNMLSMFEGCINLIELNINGFDFTNVTNKKAMFDSMPTRAAGAIIKVKDSDAQSTVLNSVTECPSDWDTTNVIIAE